MKFTALRARRSLAAPLAVSISVLACCCHFLSAEDIHLSVDGGGSSSRAGPPLRVRLSAPPSPPRDLPRIPKTLAELERASGEFLVCVERDRFLIASDLARDEYEHLVDGILAYCRRALTNQYFDRLTGREGTVNIYVFRDASSYNAGVRRFMGINPISPYGHYGHTEKYIVINYETGPGTLVHELTHALMADDFPEAPIWLAEGMASLYEQCRAEGGPLRGEPNWRFPELKSALGRGRLTPLSRLVGFSPAEFRETNESLHYAQARYLCKYLEDLGILSDIYRNFRDRGFRDPTGSETLSAVTGKSLEQLDVEWHRWLSFQSWHE